MKKYFIVLTYLILYVSQIFAQEQNLRPTLKVTGKQTDSIVVIHYSLPDSSYVEIIIFDRTGRGPVAVPVYQFQKAGDYDVIIDKSGFPIGSYFASLQINHSREDLPIRAFYNSKKGHLTTRSKEELSLQNQIGLSIDAYDPTVSMELFKKLKQEFPNFIDNGDIYYRILPTHLLLNADSISVHSIIDSLVRLIPRSYIYNYVAQTLGEEKVYITTALYYAKKAIESVNDIPLPYRDEKLFLYLKTLGDLLLYINDNENLKISSQEISTPDEYSEAEKVFIKAIQVFQNLPPYSGLVKNNMDIDVLKSLGLLREGQRDYETAMNYYKKAIMSDPFNTELWMLLQHAYTLKNGNDKGYESFKDNFEKTLPKSEKILVKDTTIGKQFPDFDFNTLDNQEISLSDLKGKITIINFWEYYCGNCLEERPTLEKIYQEYKDKSVVIIGIHSDIGKLYRSRKIEEGFIRKAMEKLPASFPTIFEKNFVLHRALGIKATPLTFILDKQGIIRYRELGYNKYTTYENLKKALDELLKE